MFGERLGAREGGLAGSTKDYSTSTSQEAFDFVPYSGNRGNSLLTKRELEGAGTTELPAYSASIKFSERSTVRLIAPLCPSEPIGSASRLAYSRIVSISPVRNRGCSGKREARPS